MKQINSQNVIFFSSIVHGSLAAIIVLCLLFLVFNEFQPSLIILWLVSIAAACFWGWKIGSWYIPIKGERWLFEPYIATPVITLLSALSSGPFYLLIIGVWGANLDKFDLGRVFEGGIFIGIFAFVLTLPITIQFGVALALYLYKYGGYKYG